MMLNGIDPSIVKGSVCAVMAVGAVIVLMCLYCAWRYSPKKKDKNKD